MKKLFLLLVLLPVIAAQQTKCVCDFNSREVICKGLHLTDYNQYGTACGYAYWKIDISKNSLEEFPKDLRLFQKVNLSRNSLENLESSVQQEVNYLDVSDNKITSIYLENNFLSLRHLYASQNYLGIDDNFLEGQCNIVHLDVSGNKIASLEAVMRCGQLSVLEASRNMISQVPNLLRLLINLEVLDLSNNKIKDVSGLPTNLKMLDLSFNNIHEISDSSFSGLASLQTLNLEANGIRRIGNGAFVNLASLQILNLEENILKSLSGDSLKGLMSLRGINLFSNSIASLSDDTFSDLRALEHIFLSANRLSILPALQLGSKVQRIRLTNNFIKKIDHLALLTMFSGARDIRVISLQFNNFRGDDPEWSNVLKYFDGKCEPYVELQVRDVLSASNILSHPMSYNLAPSPCPCAIFRRGTWGVVLCIADGSEVNGLPWLEAAEIYAGNEDDNHHY